MTQIVVTRDENGKPVLENGKPVTEEIADGVPVVSINGFICRATVEENAQRTADRQADEARRKRTKEERVDQDILPRADFKTDVVSGAVTRALLSYLPNPPTEAEFEAKVRAELLADARVLNSRDPGRP